MMARQAAAPLVWALLVVALVAAPAALGAPAGEPLAVSGRSHRRALTWQLGDTWYPGAILGAVKDAVFGANQGSSSPSNPSSSPSSSSWQQPSYAPSGDSPSGYSDKSKEAPAKGSYSPSDDSKPSSGKSDKSKDAPAQSQSDSNKSKEDSQAQGNGNGNQGTDSKQQPAASGDAGSPSHYASQAKPSPSSTTAPATSTSAPAPATNSTKLDPTNVNQVEKVLEALEANKKPANGTNPASTPKNGTAVGGSVPASALGGGIAAPVPTANSTGAGSKGATVDPTNVDQVTKALQGISANKGPANSTAPRISSSPLPSAPNPTAKPTKQHRRALASTRARVAQPARRASARRALRGFAGVSGDADLSSNILGSVDQQVQQALSNSGVTGGRQGNVALPAGTQQQQQYAPQQQQQAAPQQQQQQQQAPEQQQGGLSSEQQDALNLHNNFRARHGSPALTYSTALETSARAWAQQLANECGFRHSGPGENLASGYNSWGEVVKAWYDEISMYNFNNPSFSHQTGHFTQVVWAATTTVGCATARNPSCWEGTIFACHYRPYGNVNTQQYFRDNVRQPASS